MAVLVPSWARYYDEFWQAIHKRNLWFIKLRYGAVLVLVMFITASQLILHFSFTPDQLLAIVIITASILFYNIALHYSAGLLSTPGKIFNPLHLSVLQMMLDMTALWLLVYYTGGIETPLYLLFIFHMIIGSLILPGWIIYLIAGWFMLGFLSLVIAEYSGLLIHHGISGFLEYPVYKNSAYVFTFSTAFTFVIFISVMLANRIANQLYKMEQDLVETLNKLEQAEKEKQKYIIGVVHEIKTPLAALHSYLDLVLQKYLGPVTPIVEEKLERARRRSEEAMELVNDVLKISRVKLVNEFKKEEMDVYQLLEEIIKKEAHVIVSKSLNVTIEDRRKEKYNITGDKFWLDIALSNLINNAIKYVSEQGTVEVVVNDSAKCIEIIINDDGIGIPPEELKNIFNEFYRASNTRQIKTEGSGLGLSIVKQIIERHGGQISAMSPSSLAHSKNLGSSFIITLPAYTEV